MKLSHCFVLIGMLTSLTACTSQGRSPTQMASNFLNRQDVTPTASGEYPAKNPQNVAFYQKNNSPHAPYRIIAAASVSRRNLLGIERSDATMQTMMKQLAANMGGDGLINLNHSTESLQANVIAYQKILI